MDPVVPKKKLDEIHAWFKSHFNDSSQQDYINRCPMVIFQGPTGCGKTSALRWISDGLKVPIKEYSETTDTTALNHDIFHATRGEERSTSCQSIDRRKALKFELFVTNSLRFNTLYSNFDEQSNGADSEFDSDDGFPLVVEKKQNLRPRMSGVIIHIDTPLSFGRNQRILIQTLHKVLKIIRELSKVLSRRIAIVFESLEGEYETLALSNRVKLSLGIHTFKFNPVTRANMKKFIDSRMKIHSHITLDKETIDQLLGDCEGDLRACDNTLQMICSRNSNRNLNIGIKNLHVNQSISNELSLFHNPAAKKQKVYHDKVKQVKLSSSLLRDGTRSPGFFHALGKMFYQKRLYPAFCDTKLSQLHGRYERPYPAENDSGDLADMLAGEPRNLIAWLHQHYYKFCNDANIDKAAAFMDLLASTDTISLDSLQTGQFYESHHLSDQIQTHLAIASTVFSLYTDQSTSADSGHKRILTEKGTRILKSSVDNSSTGASGKLYSFTKPVSLSMTKLVDDYRALLSCFESKLTEVTPLRADATVICIDYLPYLNMISKNWQNNSSSTRKDLMSSTPTLGNDAMEFLRVLVDLDCSKRMDMDARHEELMELIERAEGRAKC